MALVGLKDIYFALKESQLFGSTYLYDLSINQWVRCADLAIFEIIPFDFELGEIEAAPDYTPPPPGQWGPKMMEKFHEGSHLLSLFLKKEIKKSLSLKEELSSIELEMYQERALNEQYREELKALENEIEQTNQNIHNEKGSLNEKIAQLEQQILQLTQMTQHSNSHNDDEFEELITINKKLQKKISLSEIKLKESQKEIEQYKTMLSNLKAGAKKYVIDNEILKKEVKKSQTNSHELTQKLETTRHQLKKFEEECEQNKKIILKIRNEQQKKSNEEIRRLTGESFELSNKPIWEYKQAGKVHGPYAFDEILDLKRDSKINDHTVLRNTEINSNWMALGDYFEFNAPFEVFISEEDGKPVKRFFMKRGSIRTPFYDTATISFEDQEIKGYCTSISVGGCFIELTRLKEGSFKKEQKAVLTLNHEVLGQSIICPIVIKNISLQRPKGLGVMFEAIDNESRILIENYVNQTLKKTRTLKAA